MVNKKQRSYPTGRSFQWSTTVSIPFQYPEHTGIKSPLNVALMDMPPSGLIARHMSSSVHINFGTTNYEFLHDNLIGSPGLTGGNCHDQWRIVSSRVVAFSLLLKTNISLVSLAQAILLKIEVRSTMLYGSIALSLAVQTTSLRVIHEILSIESI